jgi:hypothetical protein
MPPVLYVTAAELKNAAQESDSSGNDSWEALAKSVSRLFDRECEVPDEFFGPAAAGATALSFRGNATEYLKVYPYIAGSLEAITIDGVAVTVPAIDNEYIESEDYLVFAYTLTKNAVVSVSARWGFAEVPGDIKQACIEQGLFQWRRKDLAFTDLSGVAPATIVAQFSPTFQAVVNRFRGLYSRQVYFS